MKNRFISLSILAIICLFYTCKESRTNPPVETVNTSTTELQTILINGDSIHYMDIGKGEPIVLVHGHLGDYSTWSKQMDTFSTNHRVIAYSRRYAYPNKQHINDSADYTILPHVSDLAQLIETLQLGPVHLVGHSYGAFTALKTTIDYPELVKSLTLGEPPVMSLLTNVKGGDTLVSNFSKNALKPAAEAFMDSDDEKAIGLFISGAMGTSIDLAEVPESLKKYWLKNSVDLRGFVINEAFIPIPIDDIANLTHPILLIKGELSPVRFRIIVDELHRLLPNSTLFTLPNSSHGLQGSNPEVFNKTVLDFIENN